MDQFGGCENACGRHSVGGGCVVAVPHPKAKGAALAVGVLTGRSRSAAPPPTTDELRFSHQPVAKWQLPDDLCLLTKRHTPIREKLLKSELRRRYRDLNGERAGLRVGAWQRVDTVQGYS